MSMVFPVSEILPHAGIVFCFATDFPLFSNSSVCYGILLGMCRGWGRQQAELLSIVRTVPLRNCTFSRSCSGLCSLIFLSSLHTIPGHPFPLLPPALKKVQQGLPLITNLGEHLQHPVTAWEFSGCSFRTSLLPFSWKHCWL